MRILNFRADHPLFTQGLMAGLEQYGHEVLNVYPGGLPDQGTFMAQKIDEIKPDLIMTIGVAHHMFDTESLWPVLAQKGIPHVYWAVEDPPFFEDWSMYHAKHADLVLTVAEECLPRYRERGIKADTLEFGCNPRIHRKVLPPNPDLQHDIILITHNYVRSHFDPNPATRFPFRERCNQELVLPLVRAGYDFKIWGDFWYDPVLAIPEQFRAGVIDYSWVPWAYSSAKIVLGVQWEDSPGGHISCKTFEVLGCGAFHLALYTPAQARHFEDGKHLVYVRSADETLALADYYLSHPHEREEIAAEGQREAYTRHTYLHRAEEFTEKVQRSNLC